MLMTGNVYEHFWYQLPQVIWEKWPLLLFRSLQFRRW